MTEHFFKFASPLFFILLIFLPFIHWLATRLTSESAIGFSSLKLFGGIERSWRERFGFFPKVCRMLALVLLVFGLARPQWGTETTEVTSESVDILLTIDTSGSMKALDFKVADKEVNRLDVVKKVVDEFIAKRPYDRLGMVIFGEKAYTQCPLTNDGDALRMFLQWVRIGIVGDGTAIGNALATSVKRLKDNKTKSKIIILLTDGRSNAGEITPLAAAEIAKEYMIKVYTIGVGSDQPVPYPEETPFGVRRIMAHLEMDNETLKQIAEITGGEFYPATDTEELKQIYAKIDALEKTEVTIKKYYRANELFSYFVVPALFWLLLEFVFSQLIFIKIP